MRYVSFPLLPNLSWKKFQYDTHSATCDSRLTASVDVIISLYKFEKFKNVLEKSLESCFKNPKITVHIVAVCASESEIHWLKNLTSNSHHRLYFLDERIGIYEAWNLAIQHSSAELITNLNVDDLRLPHSICTQATQLENSYADGSFGNFVLTDDIFVSLDSSSTNHLVSSLGQFDLERLAGKSQNFMHCAPIWKRSLHERFGMFDASLSSSGDTEFWLRAMSSGAKFVPFDPVTVVYFHNPEGLSTSVASSGNKEWSRIRDAYIRRHYGG
jgi:glycosyltransferase involved in cell wall biosynthesis